MKVSHIRLPSQFFTFLGYAVFSCIFATVLLEFCAFIGLSAYHRIWPDTQVDFAEMSPAYHAYAWAPGFWKEERSRWRSQRGGYQPFLIWGVAPWHGKYINTDDTPNGSWRRTINPPGCDEKTKIEVWMFGGSALFGTGVPDWATIPSFLSDDLNSAGVGCVVVTNFGSEGYVTNQELIVLIERLKLGQKPRMVIFYDGVNDSYAGAVSPGIPTAHMSLANIKARVEGSLAGRVDFLRNSYALRLARAIVNSMRQTSVVMGAGQSESKAQATLDNYEANLHIAKILGEAYGFRVFCFWQPAFAYGHKVLSPFEMKIAANGTDQNAFRIITAVYQRAERRAARDNDFVFLGDVFDSFSEPVYIDKWMHLAPTGNKVVAQAIARRVEGSLKSSSKR